MCAACRYFEGKPGVNNLSGGQHQVDHRMFVRFTCQQGQYNDMASLLLPSLSGSFASTLSHLYSRDADAGCRPLTPQLTRLNSSVFVPLSRVSVRIHHVAYLS